MATGSVKWFDSKKGFGFILNEEGQDIFVHFSSIQGDGFRALKDGEIVEHGTHDELIRTGGVYACLHELQFSRDESLSPR